MLLNRDLQKRPEVLRDSSPETNTGPYWVCEKFKFGTFHCPCSLLGVSDGRVINSEYLTQTVRFCSYWQHMLLTLLNWSAPVVVPRRTACRCKAHHAYALRNLSCSASSTTPRMYSRISSSWEVKRLSNCCVSDTPEKL